MEINKFIAISILFVLVFGFVSSLSITGQSLNELASDSSVQTSANSESTSITGVKVVTSNPFSSESFGKESKPIVVESGQSIIYYIEKINERLLR